MCTTLLTNAKVLRPLLKERIHWLFDFSLAGCKRCSLQLLLAPLWLGLDTQNSTLGERSFYISRTLFILSVNCSDNETSVDST